MPNQPSTPLKAASYARFSSDKYRHHCPNQAAFRESCHRKGTEMRLCRNTQGADILRRLRGGRYVVRDSGRDDTYQDMLSFCIVDKSLIM